MASCDGQRADRLFRVDRKTRPKIRVNFRDFLSTVPYRAQAYHFRRSGDTLQVFLHDNEKSASKVQAEKDGWYLTGKCTEKGGEVILTMGVEQFSHWSFLPAKILDPEVQRFYIRNVRPQEPWLWMEDKGTRYRGGRETRKPVLSFEKQEVFNVEGGPHSGSK